MNNQAVGLDPRPLQSASDETIQVGRAVVHKAQKVVNRLKMDLETVRNTRVEKSEKEQLARTIQTAEKLLRALEKNDLAYALKKVSHCVKGCKNTKYAGSYDEVGRRLREIKAYLKKEEGIQAMKNMKAIGLL